MKKSLKITILAIVAIAALVSFGIYRKQRQKEVKYSPDSSTLSEAAKIGEPVAMKLLIQIKTPEDINERFERGDVVLAKPLPWEFSEAEKTGFLIIKVNLTPALADMILHSPDQEIAGGSENDIQNRESIKRRKFAADLSKIGVKDGDEQGREIEDKVFNWDILRQK